LIPLYTSALLKKVRDEETETHSSFLTEKERDKIQYNVIDVLKGIWATHSNCASLLLMTVFWNNV